jgi:hypothetical protein
MGERNRVSLHGLSRGRTREGANRPLCVELPGERPEPGRVVRVKDVRLGTLGETKPSACRLASG